MTQMTSCEQKTPDQDTESVFFTSENLLLELSSAAFDTFMLNGQ